MQFTLQDNVNVLKWAMEKTITKSLDAIIIADFPFMATPVVRQLMDTAIGYVVGKLMNVAEMEAFFLYTDVRVNQQGRDFVAAAAKHQDVLKNGTAAEKLASEQELFNKFRQLVMIKA